MRCINDRFLKILAIDSFCLFRLNRQAKPLRLKPIHWAWRHRDPCWLMSSYLRASFTRSYASWGFTYQQPLVGSIRETRAHQDLLQPLAFDCITHAHTAIRYDIPETRMNIRVLVRAPCPWLAYYKMMRKRWANSRSVRDTISHTSLKNQHRRLILISDPFRFSDTIWEC